MQEIIFVKQNKGIGEKSGKVFDMVTLSDGFDSFIVSPSPAISARLSTEGIKKGDTLNCTYNLSSGYGGLRAELVDYKKK